MADKNIRKEVKKPKKSDKKVADNVTLTPRPVMMQPELIKKEKKQR
ncbi:MAG: hypothetical protein RSB55_04080 [Oscillospiraceae bacterium]